MPFLPPTTRSSPRPQLVCTLGPASLARSAQLAEAGATSFRLNASHLTPEALAAALETVRRDCPDAPIVVDLQGAKMRLGRFEARGVVPGQRLMLARDGGRSGDGALPLPHPELFGAAHAGETLTCDDGRLRFRVLAASPDSLEVEALVAGVLKPRKGVNLLEHPVRLADLTAGDQAMLAACAGLDGLTWAFSFMADGREADWLRRRLPGAAVIGKLERQEALDGLAEIDARVDATWVCRGDLGEQLGPAGLGRFVARLRPETLTKPVLMAGQVLEHLTEHAEPTRSEVCHLHDLLARGYAGIVLSDETAIGRDPVRAAATARALLDQLGR